MQWIIKKRDLSNIAMIVRVERVLVRRVRWLSIPRRRPFRNGSTGRSYRSCVGPNYSIQCAWKLENSDVDGKGRHWANELLLLHVYNVAVKLYNLLFPYKKREVFPSSKEGASDLLACMVELELNARPHPSWIKGMCSNFFFLHLC
jgi:hypothetical protein